MCIISIGTGVPPLKATDNTGEQTFGQEKVDELTEGYNVIA